MHIKNLIIAFAFAIPAIAAADDKAKSAPTNKDTAKLGEAEIKVVAHLHHVNLMEVDMGKLAQKVGTAPVKRYGEMLVRDHSTADKDLIAFAKKRGLAKIPAEQPATEADKADMKAQMDAMAKLGKLKGADFDREYLRMMVDGHDKELAMSVALIAVSTDADLDAMLEKRKGTLQKHSDMAKELQRGNAQASTAGGANKPAK